MSKSYEGVAPLTVCRTTAPVTYVSVYAGAPVPDNVDPDDLKRLVEEGFLAEVKASKKSESDDAPAKSDKVDDILADVGSDKEKAAAALEQENAKGDKARSTLVEKLQAVIAAEPEA